jgi:SAM-dependent methyltransferase
MYKRLYDNYIFFETNPNNDWTQWSGNMSPLNHIENYEIIFENFGRYINTKELKFCNFVDDKWTISNGINCSNHHIHAKQNNYSSLINDITKIFIENTKNITINDLKIPEFSCIYGEGMDNKTIIPPIFYKFGINLEKIINIYDKINLKPKTVLEIGCGYGGFCHLFMNYYKNVKYVIVDIQPGMSFAAYFLHKLGFKIELSNEFTTFDNFLNSDTNVLFLSPQQINQIPSNSIDIIINMDSIVEMGHSGVLLYVNEMNRLVNHFVFSNNATNHLYNYFLSNATNILSNKFIISNEKSPCIEPYSHLSFELTISNNYFNNIFLNKNCQFE